MSAHLWTPDLNNLPSGHGPEVESAGGGARLASSTKQPQRPWLRTTLRGGLSLGLLVLLASQIEIAEALGVLTRARGDLLGLLALALAADRLLAAYRWHILIRGTGNSMRFMDVVRLVFVSGFLGYFMPGGVGVDVMRVYGFARASSDFSLAFTSVLVERAFAILALIVLVLIGLALQPPGIPPAVGYLAWLGLAVLAAGCVLAMETRLRRLTLLLLAAPRLTLLRRGLDQIYRQLDEYKQRPGLMLWSLLIALGFQLLRCLAPALGAAALGVSLPLAVYIVTMPMIVIATLMPISIAGLGVQDAGFVYLFGLHGMPAESALLLSLIIHALLFVSALPGAWFYMRRGI